jgi:hypothetical protein
MAAVEADDRLELPGNKELNEMCDLLDRKKICREIIFLENTLFVGR